MKEEIKGILKILETIEWESQEKELQEVRKDNLRLQEQLQKLEEDNKYLQKLSCDECRRQRAIAAIQDRMHEYNKGKIGLSELIGKIGFQMKG